MGRRLWETIYLLLQGVPSNIKLGEIESLLQNVEQVKSVHHTHVWSLDGEHHVLTSHLVLKDITAYDQVDAVRQKALSALSQYEFAHHTIQVEMDEGTCRV